MKKIIIIFTCLIVFTVFAEIVLSTPSDILYLLNWGEYIDIDDDVDYESVVTKFQKKYNCQVVLETATSSEAMYQKITAGTTAYDVVIPGDYAVKQLYDEGYLRELDVNNQEYENLVNYETIFTDSLTSIIDNKFTNGDSEMKKYFMPYLWGAYTIIYNESNPEVKSKIESEGFKALFDKANFNSSVKIGMYDTSRWAVASYLLGEGKNPNITNLNDSTTGDIDTTLKNQLIDAIYNAHFDQWDNDNLKRNVATGELDMAFVQLGDFFDALYLLYNEEGAKTEDIKINAYIPSNTAAFFDSMIIPTTCEHYDLANKFINFMLDPENAYQNACAIGYSPTLKSVVNKYNEAAENNENYYEDDSQTVSYKDFLTKYPFYLNPLYNVTNINDVYLLDPKSSTYLTTCETIINSAKNK